MCGIAAESHLFSPFAAAASAEGERRSQQLKQAAFILPETLGDCGVRWGRGIFQNLKATAEPAGGPDAEGRSVPSGFQQPHHSAAKLAAKLWDDLVKDGGKLRLNVH